MKSTDIREKPPEPLARIVSGYRWRENRIGESAAGVFRLTAEDKKPLYLKVNERRSGPSLLDEKRRLDWLKNRLPVPECLFFTEAGGREYLLMSEIRGVTAADEKLESDIPRVVEQLARGLRMFHEIPIGDCPFDARLDRKIERARRRMLEKLVDEDDFDEERAGRTAEDLFREALETRPSNEDLVFTHGDYCLPNVLLENSVLSGFIDLGDAGVADRFQDLALLSRSVAYNFGRDWEKSVFDFYGIEPDRRKIRFYRLLDEFF